MSIYQYYIFRSALVNRTRKIHHNTINEETEEKDGVARKPLVTTQFVAWASKFFAQPIMKDTQILDVESQIYYEKEWRFERLLFLALIELNFHFKIFVEIPKYVQKQKTNKSVP